MNPLFEVGAEDYYIQYKLMSKGYKIAKLGMIEYDCPNCGNIYDGSSDSLTEKYERWTNTFLSNVCNDQNLIKIKKTKQGLPSISFIWKNWGGYTIDLEEEK